MKAMNSSSVERLRVISRFESLRKILLAGEYADHLHKPLAYWALPTDRRLPLAFLGRTLSDLLNTPFAELSGTPGIGQKKIASFVQLLARVANTDAAELPIEILQVTDNGKASGANGSVRSGKDFFPGSVSEVVWSQWRASVIKHRLGDETIGRFAPSLKNVTRVIWNTPLREYTGSTLAEIRARKTHGEKRVHAVLEVFHCVHTLVAGMGTQDHLKVRMVPWRIDRAEQWIARVLQRAGVPSEQETFADFVAPLLEQIRVDTADQIARLAENRLGIGGPIASVRQAARNMGLTRARVYQLLNEINDIMMVRWPNGRHQVYELREKFLTETSQMADSPDFRQFYSAIELLYPGSRRGAAGPLEQAFVAEEPTGTPVTEAITA